ncbi:putative cyclin-B3-1 [Taenia solium]|eukprot:TsM_000236700 transcript=TsM_000236700 gene=TsM_000236700
MEPIDPEAEPPEEQELEQQAGQAKLVGRPLILDGREDLHFANPEYSLRQLGRHVRLAIGRFIHLFPVNPLDDPTSAQFPVVIDNIVVEAQEYYLFRTTTLWERDSDEHYMEAYNQNFLARCGIGSHIRVQLIEWMKMVRLWMRISRRTLHVAVGLMDLYTWLEPILLQDYQLLALAALTLATRFKSPDYRVIYFLLSAVCNFAWTQPQIVLMEVQLRDKVKRRINFPTPYRFLDIYINGFTDFSDARRLWAVRASKYLLDLGLGAEQLCRHSASTRCCGVLFLLRFLLKRHCNCANLGPGIGDACPHAGIPTWSEALTRLTALNDGPQLRAVALIYGSILHGTIVTCVPYFMLHHRAATQSITFNEYVGPTYHMIALDPVLCGLTTDDLFDIARFP